MHSIYDSTRGGSKMFEVIIVDDEPMIREGLRTLIAWETYGFKVINIAQNGREGFEKHQEYKPDLMIVDVRMPEMDGITLIEKIRKDNRHTHFIILSGHADFTYAQRAMGCHVDGYLLKPLDEDELILYLQTIYNKLADEKKLKQLAAEEKNQQREKLIIALCQENDVSLNKEFLPMYEELSHVQRNFQVLLLKVTSPAAHSDISFLKQKAKELFEYTEKGYVFTNNYEIGVLLRQSYTSKHAKENLYEELKAGIGSETFFAAIGEQVPLSHIYQSFQTASTLLTHHFYFEKGLVMDKSNLSDQWMIETNEKAILAIESYVSRLQYAFESINSKTAEKMIDELAEEMVHCRMTEMEIKKGFIQLYTNILNKLLFSNKNDPSLTAIHAQAAEIYDLPTLPSVKQFLLNRFSEIIGVLDNGNTDTQIKKMIDLIHKHYNKNLRLETLAEVFNYNSAYLGKLFKNYTGEYFNTYLDKVRIDIGKQLLQKGSKVYEVADQVGYANVDYFHRKFKKYVGTSPSAYRNQRGKIS